MSDDAQLLHHYAKEGSEAAFRELVERHIQLVHATARRLAGGDTHLADDVTQLVFTDLARKAAELPAEVVLGGWLHRHTCYTTAKAVRGESRRRARERTAMETNLLNEESARDEQWAQLAPVLDDALSGLSAEDRDAIVLRYLQQKDVRSVGLALGASENAAQKRIARALDKLREILTRRGVTVSTALLATALDAGAATMPVQAGLAATVSTTALNGAAITTGTTAASGIFTTLKTMITTKAILGATAVIAAAGFAAVIVSQSGSSAAPASTPSTPATVASAPATVSVASTPVASAPMAASAKVAAPVAAPAPAGGEAVPDPAAADPNDPFASAADPFAPATVQAGYLTVNGNSLPPGAITTSRKITLGGVGGSVSGSGGGVVMVNTGGAGMPAMSLNPANLGTPVSTVVNDDGSTTNTYQGPNGETVIMNQSADGKNKSIQVRSAGSSAMPPPNQ